MKYFIASDTASDPVVPFPVGIYVHWETERLPVWNARERMEEEQELVYEVSWIEELGAWRRFLTSQRKV